MGEHYKIIGADGREYMASLLELRAWISDGRVGPSTWIWKADEERWLPAGEWPELRWDLPEAPPPIPNKGLIAAPVVADMGARVSAYVVDWLILGALFSLMTMPWANLLTGLNEAALSESRKAVPDMGVVLQFYLVFLGVLLPLRIAYSVGFLAALGGTPGKLLFGLRVTDGEGGRLEPRQVIIRSLAEWLSIGSLGVGYLIVLVSPNRLTLHDLVSGTRVVYQAPQPDSRDGA